MIERYKPRERIPERPEKREHRKERRKRREIVHEWFKYAFLFVKTKRAAIKYVRERKKDREYIEKIEIQEKIREKINAKREKEEKVQTPIVVESAKSSIFSMSKQRKQPGTSGVRLDEIVKKREKPAHALLAVHHTNNPKGQSVEKGIVAVTDDEFVYSFHFIFVFLFRL